MKILEAFLGLIQGCPHEDQPETLTEDIKKLRAKFRQVNFFFLLMNFTPTYIKD